MAEVARWTVVIVCVTVAAAVWVLDGYHWLKRKKRRKEDDGLI